MAKRFLSEASEKCLKKSRSEAILFYGTKGTWGFMSNFAPYSVEIDGTPYATTEHYYQSQKSTSSAYSEMVRLAATPSAAARMGRAKDCPLAEDWDAKKLEVMERALRAKLRCHPVLVEALLSSGDRQLIEASPKDPFWGWGREKNGSNHLGKLWMKLREEIVAERAARVK
jgi:ribA/ribD-fused uncharacterized protein